MKERARLILALLGVLLLLFAFAALYYSLAPRAGRQQERIPAPPTFFVPPQSYGLSVGVRG